MNGTYASPSSRWQIINKLYLCVSQVFCRDPKLQFGLFQILQITITFPHFPRVDFVLVFLFHLHMVQTEIKCSPV